MTGPAKDHDGPKPEAEDKSTDSHDAADAEPVKQYYAEKKQRYLREGASDLKAGTPFEWEDAARYAREDVDPDGTVHGNSAKSAKSAKSGNSGKK